MWVMGSRTVVGAVKFEQAKCKLEFHVSQCTFPLPPSRLSPIPLFVGQPTHSFGLQMNSELADRLEREWNVNARTLDTGIGICRGTKRVRWKRDRRMIDEK